MENMPSTMNFSESDPDMSAESYTVKGDTLVPQSPRLGGVALAMFPLTPVPFAGEGSVWAYVRLGLYSAGAYLAWGKARKLSYALMGAAALSAATSTTAVYWNRNKKP